MLQACCSAEVAAVESLPGGLFLVLGLGLGRRGPERLQRRPVWRRKWRPRGAPGASLARWRQRMGPGARLQAAVETLEHLGSPARPAAAVAEGGGGLGIPKALPRIDQLVPSSVFDNLVLRRVEMGIHGLLHLNRIDRRPIGYISIVGNAFATLHVQRSRLKAHTCVLSRVCVRARGYVRA